MLSCYNSSIYLPFNRKGAFMKKQPHITEQTKANLCTAFWKLYTQKPLEKISIKEITDLAGYNRGTFYLYYKDIYDIFSQIEEELLTKIKEVLDESLAENDTFDLSQQMGILLDLMQTYEQYSTILLSDNGDPHFATRLKEIIWPMLNRYFVPSEGHSAYQMSLLSEFYLSGLLSSVIRWLKDPQITLEEFLHFMVKNALPIPDSPQSYNNCGMYGGTQADR